MCTCLAAYTVLKFNISPLCEGVLLDAGAHGQQCMLGGIMLCQTLFLEAFDYEGIDAEALALLCMYMRLCLFLVSGSCSIC
jgi:hypothetical protein